jgi:hypothetical protein
MTPLDQALEYAAGADGWPVFPCAPDGTDRKKPLTQHGLRDATIDQVQIAAWWRRWPRALIGVPTGAASGFVVLDVDVKRLKVNGFDTLADLGYAALPNTPMVHTSSGGLHLYFAPPAPPIRNTAGSRGRGLGAGLDWRADGGYVIVPSPGSGYEWDPDQNFGLSRLAEVPPGLLPRETRRPTPIGRPARPEAGLSPYAEAALDSACRAIVAAPDGQQEATLNAEAFSIGTLAGAGGIPERFAIDALIWAGRQMPSFAARDPWQPWIIEAKVRRAFDAGVRHPRAGRDAA